MARKVCSVGPFNVVMYMMSSAVQMIDMQTELPAALSCKYCVHGYMSMNGVLGR